jgi:hypothetical protein
MNSIILKQGVKNNTINKLVINKDIICSQSEA